MQDIMPEGFMVNGVAVIFLSNILFMLVQLYCDDNAKQFGVRGLCCGLCLA